MNKIVILIVLLFSLNNVKEVPVAGSFLGDVIDCNILTSMRYQDELEEIEKRKNAVDSTAADEVLYNLYSAKSKEIRKLNSDKDAANSDTAKGILERIGAVRCIEMQIDDIMNGQLESLDRMRELANQYATQYSDIEDENVVEIATIAAEHDLYGTDYAINKMTKEEKAKKLTDNGVNKESLYSYLIEAKRQNINDMSNSDKQSAQEKIIMALDIPVEEKNKIANEYINNVIIIPKENDYNFSSEGELILSKMTDNQQERWKDVHAYFTTMTESDYAEIVSEMGKYKTKKEKIAYLETAGFNKNSAHDFYILMTRKK